MGSSQEQYRRFGQQLQGDVDPFELATGELVGPGVGVLGQPQLAHHLIHPGVALGGLDVGREAQLGAVLQRPPGGQLGVHDAVLRHQPDPGPQLGVVLVQVAVVVQHHAAIGRAHPGQRAEQGGLTGAAGADDADQGPFAQREAHVVQQDLAAGHLDHEILRDQRHIAGVDVFAQRPVDEPESGRADADNVFLGQRGRGNRLPIDKCAVMTAQIDNLILSVTGFAQFGVVAGGGQVGKDQVIVGRPADAHPVGGQRQHGGGPAVDAEAIVLGRARGAAGTFGAPGLAIARRAGTAGRSRGRRGGAGARWGRVGTRPGSYGAQDRRVGARGPAGGRPVVIHPGSVAAVPRRDLGRCRRCGRDLGEGLGGWRGGGCGPGQRTGQDRRLDLDGDLSRRRTRNLGRRVRGPGGRLAPQDRAVVRIAEPNYTFGTNCDAIHATSTDKRPVGTAGIFEYPGVLFMAQHSMTPRDAGISKYDVGRRIPAQLVVRTRLQSMVRLPGPNDQYRASPRRSGTQRRHVDDCRGDVHKGE